MSDRHTPAEPLVAASRRIAEAITSLSRVFTGLDLSNWGTHVKPGSGVCVLSRCPHLGPHLGPCLPHTCPGERRRV